MLVSGNEYVHKIVFFMHAHTFERIVFFSSLHFFFPLEKHDGQGYVFDVIKSGVQILLC